MEKLSPREAASPDLQDVADLVADIASLLMTSGAHTARVVRNASRVAEAFGFEAQISLFQLSIILTVSSKGDPHHRVTLIRKIKPPLLDFTIVSKISIRSWRTLDSRLSVKQVRQALARIQAAPRRSRWWVLLMAGVANASFCRLFGGDGAAMLLVLLGTWLGLFVRQELHHRGASHYVVFLTAAFVSSFVAGMGFRYGWGNTPQIALATSVLFLVPGVPFLNAFTDIIEGHVLTGTSRTVNAAALMVCVSLGLLLTMLSLGLEKL